MKTTRTQASTTDLQRKVELFSSLPDEAGVRLPVVRELLGGVGAATVWRMSADGRLPAPRKISAGVTVWPVGELRRFLRG